MKSRIKFSFRLKLTEKRALIIRVVSRDIIASSDACSGARRCKPSIIYTHDFSSGECLELSYLDTVWINRVSE